MYWHSREHPEPEPAPSWKCHGCGHTGTDEPGMNEATHITPESVYLRPHCGTCLPAPPGRQDPTNPTWRAFHKNRGRHLTALQNAADNGTVDARTVGRTQCPVCGQTRTDGRGPDTPTVYAVTADQDESTCGPCLDQTPQADITDAYRRRATGAHPAWA
ncbi:hypothetical protein [Streptomyces bacillaris]|uniref:hypothetical protein n=1 Tax=Streptomyces bacillaris TaxID=68179 RepID=UPI00363EB1B0